MRDHRSTEREIRIKAGVFYKVHITRQHKARGVLKKRFKRRNEIEPVIGHEKQYHTLGRNYLRAKKATGSTRCYPGAVSI